MADRVCAGCVGDGLRRVVVVIVEEVIVLVGEHLGLTRLVVDSNSQNVWPVLVVATGLDPIAAITEPSKYVSTTCEISNTQLSVSLIVALYSMFVRMAVSRSTPVPLDLTLMSMSRRNWSDTETVPDPDRFVMGSG